MLLQPRILPWVLRSLSCNPHSLWLHRTLSKFREPRSEDGKDGRGKGRHPCDLQSPTTYARWQEQEPRERPQEAIHTADSVAGATVPSLEADTVCTGRFSEP